MKRIFGNFAYDPDRIKGCYWAQDVPDSVLTTSPLLGDQQAEVGIIGGGYTGLNAALHLAQDGISATVVEANFPGWGASGRNGGFACLGGSKASSKMLTRAHGDEARRAYREAEKNAVTHVADLLEQHHIEADTHSRGETQVAHTARAFGGFSQQAEQVHSDYGLTAQIIPRAALPDHGLAGPFHGAMTIPHGFALNPRKYLAGLLRVAHAAGARVHSHSPVTRIEPSLGGYVLHLPGGRLRCRKLIIATNGYSSDDVPSWMAARYIPAQSSVLVTRPLSNDEIAAAGWSSDQATYDSRYLLHYFRLMPNRRFLFGMRGGLRASPAADAAIHRQIRREFETMFPAWSHVETPHYWSGMVCLAANLVPFCGAIPEMPGAFAGFAYHGNGVAMASYTGTLLADLAMGKPTRLPHPAVMQATPKRFPLGPYRRALMWPAYAVKGLQDL